MKTITKKFRVIKVSEGTNLLELYQFIAIAETGESFKLHTGISHKPTKGQDINIVYTILDSGELKFKKAIGMNIKKPIALSNATEEILKEAFKEEKMIFFSHQSIDDIQREITVKSTSRR